MLTLSMFMILKTAVLKDKQTTYFHRVYPNMPITLDNLTTQSTVFNIFTAVTFQIVRFLETVVGTEFACRGKMTKMFLAGTWCLTNLHFFFSSFAPAQYLDESYFPFSI